MAKRMHVVLEDDLDGSEAVETLAFTVDGVAYEIDLSADNAARFRDSVSPWVGAARRVGGRRSTGRKAKVGSANDIRTWALGQGMHVSSRGRVSQEVREAYEAAH